MSGQDHDTVPSFLIAMPQLQDPNFNRSVVLLCSFNTEGAFGVIVNRPLNVNASEVVMLEPPLDPEAPLSVWEGGPVDQRRPWLLRRDLPPTQGAIRVSDEVYLQPPSEEGLRDLTGDHRGCEPDRARLLVGYAGWAPGQLDSELSSSAWLLAPFDVDLMFTSPAEELWERAIRSIGVEPGAISPAPGIH